MLEHLGQRSFTDLVPLPLLLETVDLFFLHCHNQPYCFFHEAKFRQSLSKRELPQHLLYAVMASAVRFSDNPFFEDKDEAAEVYATKSWDSLVPSHITHNGVGDLQSVQTVTLLAIFDLTGSLVASLPSLTQSLLKILAGKDRHTAAWLKIGLSVRLAQDLKLMMESGTHLSVLEQEERRRVFWSIYLLDKLVSCGRSRPPAIFDASCRLLLPCDEATWRLSLPKVTLILEDFVHRIPTSPDQWSPGANVITVAHTLSKGAQYMLQQVNIRSRDPPWDSNSDFAWILSDLLYLESVLEVWKSPRDIVAQWTSADGRIDQQCAGPIIFARALFHLCYCLLHHPFLLRKRLGLCHRAAPSSFLSRAFDTAWEHSKSMIDLLDEVQRAGAIAHIPFYGYCTLVAASIAALHINQSPEWERTESALILKRSRKILHEIKYWKNVSSIVRKDSHPCGYGADLVAGTDFGVLLRQS